MNKWKSGERRTYLHNIYDVNTFLQTSGQARCYTWRRGGGVLLNGGVNLEGINVVIMPLADLRVCMSGV